MAGKYISYHARPFFYKYQIRYPYVGHFIPATVPPKQLLMTSQLTGYSTFCLLHLKNIVWFKALEKALKFNMSYL